MTIRLHPVFKWLLLAVFFAWGTILTVLICGDDNPEMPLTLFDFFIIKILAIMSAYSTYKAAEWCYRKDYFPALVRKYIESCDKMEEDDEI